MDFQELYDELQVAKEKGDIDGQFQVWRQLLSLSQQNANATGEIEALRQLGNLYQARGDIQKGHASRLSAFELAENPQSRCIPVIHLLVVGDLGRSFIVTNDWSKAEIYTRRALDMAKQQNEKQFFCVYAIGLQQIFFATERDTEALELAKEIFRDAQSLLSEPEGQKNYVLAQQHLTLATYWLSQHHVDRCIDHARKALAYADAAMDPLLKLQVQKILGASYSDARILTGRKEYSADAEQYLQEVINIGKKSGNPRVEAEAEAELALLYELHQVPLQALDHYQRALDLVEVARAGLGYDEFQLAFARTIQPICERAIEYFLKQNKIDVAFHTIERLRNRLLLMHMGETRVNSKVWTSEDQEKLDVILDQYDAQAIYHFYGDGTGGKKRGVTLGSKPTQEVKTLETSDSRLDTARQHFVRLYDSHHVERPSWKKRQLPPAIDLNEAQNLLDSESVLLSYWSTPKNLIVFALTRNTCHFQQLAYTSKNLEDDISETLREIYAIQDEVLNPFVHEVWQARGVDDPWPLEILRSMESFNKASSKLYGILIAPLLPVIGNYPHWVIVPNGPLHQLPWAALRTPHQYLVETHSLSILPSASSGQVLNSLAPMQGGKAIFLADPDIDNWQLGLPASQAEVQAAYESLKCGPKPFIGSDATKTNLLAHLTNVKLLHLACHHVFDANTPLLSFLKLAGESGRDSLHAFEISELDIPAELVTLSACQSGRSRTEAGDEQYGLVRAFLAAGAQSVISTLWSIEDESAADFFSHFYQLATQQALGVALQNAQKALLEDARYCLPCFWAPYTLSGRWDRRLHLS